MSNNQKTSEQSESELICNACQKPVKGRIVTALGKNWHPEHFICGHCNKPITGDKFNQNDGTPYCETDYSNLFLKRCHKCNQPIKDKIIVAMDKYWHEEHFTCTKCDMHLAGTSFFEKDGQPYCQDDYNILFAPRCHACQQPIGETAIMAIGKKWHQNCFRCMKCNQPVVDKVFEVVDDKPVCANCSK